MTNNEKIVLFLGSGATAGSGLIKNYYKLPTDQKFFKKGKEGGVPKIIPDWEKGYPALKLCREAIPTIKLDSLYQTWNDLFIYRSLARAGIIREKQETLHAFNALSNHNWHKKEYEWRAEHYGWQFRLMNQSLLPAEYFFAELAIWDLRTLVKDVYGALNDEGSVYQKFKDIVEKEIGEIATVVNLNYDTTFDDSKVIDYYYPGDGKPKEGKIPIIRPHGSLKWTDCSNWRLGQNWTGWRPSYDNTHLKEMGYKSTGDPMLLDFKQPLIVTPADFKEEVVGNSSMPGLQNSILRQQWIHLNQTLKEFNHWVFVGTSFASGDDHLLWLLKNFYRKCETKISCFIKHDCQPIWNLKTSLGCKNEDINVYKIKNETIDKFEPFKSCEKPKCNHSS